MAALLAVQMLSPVVLLLPLYALVERLGLVDTHLGLILVYAAMQVPFTVWVLKNFFDGVPPALFEAARLDGASRLRTLWSIVLPLIAPGSAATTIFNLAAYWSSSRSRSCCSIRSSVSRSRSASSACRAPTKPSGSSWPRPASSASCR